MTTTARRSFGRLLLASLLGAAALAPARAALAQSPDEINIARQTAGDGLQAYREGNFEKALRLFEDAKAIYPSAQILRMVGYSLLGLERWEKAAQAMESALKSDVGPLSSADRDDVQRELGKALAHLGTVNVTAKAPGAELAIDGGDKRPLPLEQPVRLLEGKHKLVVTAPDHEDVAQDIDLKGGSAVDLALDPKSAKEEPPPPPPPAPKPPPPPPPPSKGWIPAQRPIGFAAAGAGVLLGGAALTAALAGANIRSNVEADVDLHHKNFGQSCDKGDLRLCNYDRELINRDSDRADGLRDASVWMGIGAGVLVAAGAVLVIFAPPDDAAPQKGQAPKRRIACAPLLAVVGGSGPNPQGLACEGAF